MTAAPTEITVATHGTRLDHVEDVVRRVEDKLDRLTWICVTVPLGAALSVIGFFLTHSK